MGLCMMDGLTIRHVGGLKFRQVWLGDGPYRLWVVDDFWVFFPLMVVGWVAMLAQVVTNWDRIRVFLFLDYWFQRRTNKDQCFTYQKNKKITVCFDTKLE